MTRGYQRLDIYLNDEERTKLRDFTSKGNNPNMIVRRANVILALDKNGDKPLACNQAASTFGIHPTAISNIKRDYLNLGVDNFLMRKVRLTPPREVKITGEVEAHIIALSCQDPPKGYARWTLKLLANKAVELGYIDSISDHSVGNILKKANSNRTSRSAGV